MQLSDLLFCVTGLLRSSSRGAVFSRKKENDDETEAEAELRTCPDTSLNRSVTS